MINNLSFEIKDAYLVAIYANTNPECEVTLTFWEKETDETATAKIMFDSEKEERECLYNDLFLGGHYRVTGNYKLKENRMLVVDTDTVKFDPIERG